jgi:hypothetical protein
VSFWSWAFAGRIAQQTVNDIATILINQGVYGLSFAIVGAKVRSFSE